jgi:hypothetical protein
MKTVKQFVKLIIYPFIIRNKIIKMIKRTTGERNYFKDVLKRETTTELDVKYLESRIEIKNEVLYQLRNLL